jgi:hypothetical protein
MGEVVEQWGAAFYGEGWEKWVFSKTPSRSRRGGKESPRRAWTQRFSMRGKKIFHEKGSKRRPARNARRGGGEEDGMSTHETGVIKGGDAEMDAHRCSSLKASGKPPAQWRSLDVRWLCRRSLGRPPFWWFTWSFLRRPVVPRRPSRRLFGMGGGTVRLGKRRSRISPRGRARDEDRSRCHLIRRRTNTVSPRLTGEINSTLFQRVSRQPSI